ncbi:MAG: hypothetical protein MJZ30_11515 [Paludibacteraceae bacterium]|nr:hypothetical protein [Paludibacteraceae bacterium]
MASQTLLQRLTERIEQGVKFEISFEKKTLKVDGKLILSFKNGDPVLADGYKDTLLGVEFAGSTKEALIVINGLYQIYKHSRPSQRSDRNSVHSYFKAMPESELSNNDILNGAHREVARFELEYHVLVYSMSSLLKWDVNIMGGSYFYKSPLDRDLIILRQWLE